MAVADAYEKPGRSQASSGDYGFMQASTPAVFRKVPPSAHDSPRSPAPGAAGTRTSERQRQRRSAYV